MLCSVKINVIKLITVLTVFNFSIFIKKKLRNNND